MKHQPNKYWIDTKLAVYSFFIVIITSIIPRYIFTTYNPDLIFNKFEYYLVKLIFAIILILTNLLLVRILRVKYYSKKTISFTLISILFFIGFFNGIRKDGILNGEFVKKNYTYHVIAEAEYFENYGIIGGETSYPIDEPIVGEYIDVNYSNRTIIPFIRNHAERKNYLNPNRFIVIDSLIFLETGLYRNYSNSNLIKSKSYFSCPIWCYEFCKMFIQSSYSILEIIIETTTRFSLFWRLILIYFLLLIARKIEDKPAANNVSYEKP